MKTLIIVMGIVIGTSISGWIIAREQSGCGATGISGSNPTCTGYCGSPSNTCRTQSGSNAVGPYKYCGCASSTETGCCHLIRYSSGAQNGTYSKEGNCNIGQFGCSDPSKICTLAGSGTATSAYQALCSTVIPPN